MNNYTGRCYGTWNEGKKSQSQEAVCLGHLPSHMTREDEKSKQEKQTSKKEQKQCEKY